MVSQAGSGGAPLMTGPAAFWRSMVAWLRRSRRRVASLAILISAAVAGLAEFTSAVEQVVTRVDKVAERIFPPATPTPTPVPPPEPNLQGNLTELRLSRIETQENYIDGWHGSTEDLMSWERTWPGQVVVFNVTLQGTPGQRCYVTWTLFDAESRMATEYSAWDTIATSDGVQPVDGFELKPSPNNTAAYVGEIWVPMILDGRYYVEIKMWDETRTTVLDTEFSPAFEFPEAD